MSALDLVDLLPHLGDLPPRAVGQWVSAALAQAAALRAHDGWLYPTDPARRPAAERLHEAWRQWADDAEALLGRAESLPGGGGDVPGLDALRDTIGRTRAMLQLTPDTVARRRAQVGRGDVRPIEEVRRELRAESRG